MEDQYCLLLTRCQEAARHDPWHGRTGPRSRREWRRTPSNIEPDFFLAHRTEAVMQCARRERECAGRLGRRVWRPRP